MTYDQAGVVNVMSDCHPRMSGWVVVVDRGASQVTRPEGLFRFDGVPPGRYRLRLWHESQPRRYEDRELTLAPDEVRKESFEFK